MTDQILPDNQYFKQEFNKRSIVLHHTASSGNGHNVVHGWMLNPEKIGTAYVVCGKPDKTNSYKDGEIIRAFDDKYWAYHLGIKAGNNDFLNSSAIGIEICSYGQLMKKGDKFYDYLNQEVAPENVVELPELHKGFKYYYAYTDAQIEAVKNLIIALSGKYNIPVAYSETMFSLNAEALAGKGGLWTHNSYRQDKVDVAPQPKLIQMLKSL